MAATLATRAFRMADRMAAGQLTQEMHRLFTDSQSWEQVSRDLYATHGVEVSGQTLRRWARELGIDGTDGNSRMAVS